MMIARKGIFVLGALLAILSVGLGVNLNNLKGQEGGQPTSFGPKCAICLSAGCPDRGTLMCSSVDAVSDSIAAELQDAGFEIDAGPLPSGMMCYKGRGPVQPCVVDPT